MVIKSKKSRNRRDISSGGVVPRGRFWLYLISFIFPLIGFVLALGYAHGIESNGRVFGKRCFILGISGIFLYILFVVSWALYIFFKA